MPPSTMDETIAEALLPGEQVEVSVRGLVKVVLQLFNRCVVVLTDRRLLVFSSPWSRGYKLEEGYARDACAVLSRKVRFDGSRLVVVRARGDTITLHFARSVQSEADAVCAALSAPVDALGQANAEALAEESETQLQALEELGGLTDTQE